MNEAEIYFHIQNVLAYAGIALVLLASLYVIVIILLSVFNKRK